MHASIVHFESITFRIRNERTYRHRTIKGKKNKTRRNVNNIEIKIATFFKMPDGAI